MSDIAKAMKKIIAEIDEILAKSSHMMKKNEPEKEDQSEDKLEASEKMEDKEELEEASEKMEDKEEPKEKVEELEKEEDKELEDKKEASDEMLDDMDDLSKESEMSSEDSLEDIVEQGEDSLEMQAKDLSDEELSMIIDVLMKEKESRSQKQEEMDKKDEKSKEKDELEMSMKKEYAKMHKSMQSLINMITDLKTEISALKAEKKAKAYKIIGKAAANNIKDVQVLEKTTPIKKRLSKSETIDFLFEQLKNKNKLVNSQVIHDVTCASSDDELAKIQDSLEKKGLKFPKI